MLLSSAAAQLLTYELRLGLSFLIWICKLCLSCETKRIHFSRKSFLQVSYRYAAYINYRKLWTMSLYVTVFDREYPLTCNNRHLTWKKQQQKTTYVLVLPITAYCETAAQIKYIYLSCWNKSFDMWNKSKSAYTSIIQLLQ